MPANEPTRLQLFAQFVAILTGSPRGRAMDDLEIDAPHTMAAGALLEGDHSASAWFDPRRVDRALRYADDVGLRRSV